MQREFDVICVSESWLNDDDSTNEYMLDNYDVVVKNRNNKRGGGVMIYVLRSLKFKFVTELSESIDNVFECVSIEIETIKNKNIIVTCLYRAPGTNIEIFNEHLENLLSLVKQNKTYFLVGET